MGQDPGAERADVTEGESESGARDPEEIRREIEETRAEMGDTVEALAEKTDVKSQAKRKVDEAKASVSERKDELLGKAKGAAPDNAGAAAGQMSSKAKENPLPLAVAGGFLAGFLLGRLTNR
jgi:chromosome segregation ATPase